MTGQVRAIPQFAGRLKEFEVFGSTGADRTRRE
jgi:hypothetical protein